MRPLDVTRALALALLALACSREETSLAPSPMPASEDASGPVTVSDLVPSQGAEALEVSDEDLLQALGYIASEPVPETTGVVHHDPVLAQPGWNLYVTQAGQEATLIDMNGALQHAWHAPREERPPGADGKKRRFTPWWRTVRLLEDGGLLAQTDFGPIERLDRDSKRIWRFDGHTHHDFDVDDAGHVYVLTSKRTNVPGFRGQIADDFIVELDVHDGREIRTLSITQALSAGSQHEILGELQQFQRETRSIAAVDPLHTNSVEWLDGRHAERLAALARGNLLISLPMIGRVAIVDLDAGAVVWSLKGSFEYQHHPTLLESGNILLFDNKGLGPGRSRILEIDTVTGAEVWSYGTAESEAFYSECCGRVYRLENGNTLVVDSKSGRAFEVAPNRERVWEFRSPHTLREKVANLNDLVRVGGWGE